MPAPGLQQVADKIATLLMLAQRQRKTNRMTNREKANANFTRRTYVTKAYRLSALARNPKLSRKLREALTYIPSETIRNATRYLNGNNNRNNNRY
jgi:hypothetical protein